ENKKAESGIFLGEVYGKGIGTQAYKLLLDYAFNELGMHKVVARVLAGNTASVRLHEKSGYKQEAYLRDELFLDGKYEDLILFGAINNDGKDK
ncbi:MAG: GNAT family N-acetyltransferase, partial [Lachnospiraceae bacterium]|nr:GNAT family N-acetyltransferase [Lachnospiraceae bacterium]